MTDVGTAPAPSPPQVSRAAYVEQIMGMPVSLHLRGPQAWGAQAAGVVREVFALLREVDALFSTYRADSEVSRVNAGTLALADVHPLVREVNDLAVIARARTRGLFDVHLPVNGGRTYDPSGLVKGWAVERAATLLAALPEHDFCLNVGGDVAVGCRRKDAEPWRVAIEDPRAPGVLLGVVERRDGGVATSGTAARGAHLVDPRDGSRPTALLSVTVLGPSIRWADVLATAAFVRGADAAEWLRCQLGYQAVVVRADGTVVQTPGLALTRLDG